MTHQSPRFGHPAAAVLGWLLMALAGSAPAAIINPTPQRSYVSLSGSDTNNCGPTAPCRTWQAALAQTQPGGEILTLNSGGFGLLTITQSVTLVVPPGVYGGMSPPAGQDGVRINAPGARVVLRGLTIEGQGGTNGINILAAGTVLIEDSTIEDMITGVTDSSAGALEIHNSKVRSNTAVGVNLAPASGTLVGRITGSDISYNGTDGAALADHVQVQVMGSNLSHNGLGGTGWGVNAVGTLTASPTISIDAQNNDLSYNASGGLSLDDTSGALANSGNVSAYLDHNDLAGGASCLNVAGTASVILSGNTMEGCTTGVSVAAGGNGSSYGNNAIGPANATDVGGTVNQPLTAKAFW